MTVFAVNLACLMISLLWHRRHALAGLSRKPKAADGVL
jgi:hypothetical protein